ncbi:hypothetical protein DY000_02059108 [Brassica cretica]|uniref:Uncharacterized protein n=1 Tax=Brassica cretica TaxID=69181 RepID=A0ABQ7B503_BRACR|nr:hypothetical protein DY000_02059108 [Brassica cretica]
MEEATPEKSAGDKELEAEQAGDDQKSRNNCQPIRQIRGIQNQHLKQVRQGQNNQLKRCARSQRLFLLANTFLRSLNLFQQGPLVRTKRK